MIEVFKLTQGYYQIKLYWRLLGSHHSRPDQRALWQFLSKQRALMDGESQCVLLWATRQRFGWAGELPVAYKQP